MTPRFCPFCGESFAAVLDVDATTVNTFACTGCGAVYVLFAVPDECSPDEWGELVDREPQSVRRQLQLGTLPGYKEGGRWVVTPRCKRKEVRGFVA